MFEDRCTKQNFRQLCERLRDMHIWEFPKIRGTLSWGPYNKDPTI